MSAKWHQIYVVKELVEIGTDGAVVDRELSSGGEVPDIHGTFQTVSMAGNLFFSFKYVMDDHKKNVFWNVLVFSH